MVNRNLVIVIAVLIIVFLGFMFISNMTGNAITGSVATEKVIVSDEFRIDEIVDEVPEEINDTQNSSGSK